MEKILFINSCVRSDSRTYSLAQSVLKRLGGNVEEVNLQSENIQPLNGETLRRREELSEKNDFSDPLFKYARQFSQADVIVVAAPYWDLSFPASVKIYFEAVNVLGVTFVYTPEGIPKGLCKARRLIYVTTAGGMIYDEDFGFNYVKALAKDFYGITDILCFKAEMLDIQGADTEAILEKTGKEIADSDIGIVDRERQDGFKL